VSIARPFIARLQRTIWAEMSRSCIAGKVQGDGKNLTDADVQGARKLGATDLEIHDTLLIASMFCMCSGNGWHTDKTSSRPRSNVTQRLVRKTKRKSKQTTRLKEH
jgi:hypothetical protein